MLRRTTEIQNQRVGIIKPASTQRHVFVVPSVIPTQHSKSPRYVLIVPGLDLTVSILVVIFTEVRRVRNQGGPGKHAYSHLGGHEIHYSSLSTRSEAFIAQKEHNAHLYESR